MAREVAVFILVLFLGAVAVGDQAPTSPKAIASSTTSPCGRYQLFQGVYGTPGRTEYHRLLRIDTETGHTWIYFGDTLSTEPDRKDGWIDVREWQASGQTIVQRP